MLVFLIRCLRMPFLLIRFDVVWLSEIDDVVNIGLINHIYIFGATKQQKKIANQNDSHNDVHNNNN